MVSALLFVVTLSTLSGAIFTPDNVAYVRHLLQLDLLPLFSLYLLSRTRHYRSAALLTIPILMLTPYISLAYMQYYSQSRVAESIMWLLMPMCVAVITLSLRTTIAFLLANILLLISLPFWVEGFEFVYLSNGLSLIIIVSLLFLVISAMRERDVEELHRRSEELQRQKQWLEQEIEERQQVEMEVGNLQSLINSVNEAVLLVSTTGFIQRVNETTTRMFGFDSGSFAKRNITTFIQQSKADSDEQLLACFLRDEIDNTRRWHSFMARHADGHMFPAEAYASLIVFNDSRSFVVTVRDMTEHKRIERMKDEFVSSVSHELRTPLTSIQGAIGLINGMYRDQLSDKVQGLVKIVYDNSSSLCSLVDDILDISKLESGKMLMQFESILVAEQIQELLRSCTPLAEKHSVSLRMAHSQAKIAISTDRLRFNQVLRNLLSNAAKFSPAGDTVEVRFAQQGDRLHIQVIDHGIGIPLQYQNRIFDKFFQVEGTSKQARSGTGLGLSITKRIVEQMHGRIWVESVPGNTCFHLELPLRQG